MTAPSNSIDGFGQRRPGVDAENGDQVELLDLAPELIEHDGFVTALAERVARFASMRHTSYAHLRRLDRPEEHRLQLVSDLTPGWRLSELFAESAEAGVVVDVNVFIGLMRQLLPAVALYARHNRDAAIGTLAPERLIVTPQARLVIAEHAFGPPLEKLNLGRDKLWRDYRVTMAPSAGLPRANQRADAMGIGAVALALLMGRVFSIDEFPASLDSLVAGAQEYRNGQPAPVSAALSTWLKRALQLEADKEYQSPAEAQLAFETVLISERSYVMTPAVLENWVTTIGARLDAKKPQPEPEPAPVPVAVVAPEATASEPQLLAVEAVVEEEDLLAEEPVQAAVEEEQDLLAEEPAEPPAVQEPVVQEQAVQDEPVQEPTVQEEPVQEEPVQEPAAEIYTAAQQYEAPAPEAAVELPQPEPVADEPPVPEPVSDELPLPEPVAVEPPVPEPVSVEPPVPEPVADEPPLPEPVAVETPLPEPVRSVEAVPVQEDPIAAAIAAYKPRVTPAPEPPPPPPAPVYEPPPPPVEEPAQPQYEEPAPQYSEPAAVYEEPAPEPVREPIPEPIPEPVPEPVREPERAYEQPRYEQPRYEEPAPPAQPAQYEEAAQYEAPAYEQPAAASSYEPAPPAHEAPWAPQAPEAPEAPQAPQAPWAPQAPEAPQAPQAPQAPEPEAPKAPNRLPMMVMAAVIVVLLIAVGYFATRGGGGGGNTGNGEVAVTTRNPGASVKIDGKPSGVTPLTVSLPPGPHVIEVQMGNGEPRVVPVMIKSGIQTAQYVELPEPLQPQKVPPEKTRKR